MKNIIFDLGGVLLDIDYAKTENAFVALGYENFHAMYSQFTADELFKKLETGKIGNEEFYEVLVRAHAGEVSRMQICTAWNAMLGSWRKESLLFLKEAAAKYKIFLLSNTNAIHFDAFHQSLFEETGLAGIDAIFQGAYWSHKIHRRKPDAETFDFVLEDAGITAAETLFIDDSNNNIDAAAKAGLKTCLLLPGMRIENLNYGFW